MLSEGFSDPLFSVAGKFCVVTGASRGIGKAIANALHQRGAQVLGLARTDISGVEWDHQVCDLTKFDQVTRTLASYMQSSGSLDVLVNCAGATIPYSDDSYEADIASVLAANTIAPLLLTDLLRDEMSQDGSVINVTSIAAHVGLPGNPAYAASKGALSAATKSLACDLAPQGIRVNNIVPGYIRTQMTAGSYSDTFKRDLRSDRTVLGRWGDVDDLIGAAIFLASNASKYVTGTDLIVDGGWIAKGL